MNGLNKMFQTPLFFKIKTVVLLAVMSTLIVACHNNSNSPTETTASEPTSASVPASENSSAANASNASMSSSMPLPGSDRDAHGCIASAGFIWCTKENACVKPWDYAAGVSIPNTLEAVNSYCGN